MEGLRTVKKSKKLRDNSVKKKTKRDKWIECEKEETTEEERQCLEMEQKEPKPRELEEKEGRVEKVMGADWQTDMELPVFKGVKTEPPNREEVSELELEVAEEKIVEEKEEEKEMSEGELEREKIKQARRQHMEREMKRKREMMKELLSPGVNIFRMNTIHERRSFFGGKRRRVKELRRTRKALPSSIVL